MDAPRGQRVARSCRPDWSIMASLSGEGHAAAEKRLRHQRGSAPDAERALTQTCLYITFVVQYRN